MVSPFHQGWSSPEATQDTSSRCQEPVLCSQGSHPFPAQLRGLSLSCRGSGDPLPVSPTLVGMEQGARLQPHPSPEAWPWQLQRLRYSGN